LEGVEVGDLGDQPDLVRPRGITESAHGDAQRPEDLLALGRVPPVVDVVDLVRDQIRGHVLSYLVQVVVDLVQMVVWWRVTAAG
jgi:hypothetical protein